MGPAEGLLAVSIAAVAVCNRLLMDRTLHTTPNLNQVPLLSSLLYLHEYDHHEEPGKRRDARRGRCQEGSPRGRLT